MSNKFPKIAPENSAYLIIIFLFWPFLSFFLACKDFKNKISRRIILAFFVLYGLLFFINPAMDGQRRADSLKEIYEQPFENLFSTFDNLYEETLDVFEPVLIFTVSRITDVPGVLFAVYSLIFGSLMLYYLRRMYGHYSINPTSNVLVFFTLLVCVNPIDSINGFRMWFAAWIFSVGVLNYMHKSNFKFILVSACSIFVHFSYIPIVALFAVYTIIKNRPKIYGIIAIITFFVAELNIEQVRQYAGFLGTASETKITSYTNEEYIEVVAESAGNAVWYIQFINNGIKYFVLISLLLVFYKTRGIFKTKITANFYSFTLLVLSFANISSLLPSGGRFYKIFYIFSFSTLLLYYIYENTDKKISLINKLGIPITALYVIFTFRLISDTASVYLLGPSILMPFAFIQNVSLQSIIF